MGRGGEGGGGVEGRKKEGEGQMEGSNSGAHGCHIRWR